MELAIVFAAVATVWLLFRKWIAQRQVQFISSVFGGGEQTEIQEDRVKAAEKFGVLFSVLLLAAAAVIAVLSAVASR